MAILKYHPPLTEIRDNRTTGKGYYDAKCEVCGTLFYPKRSNAKYCTTKCALINHRISLANGTATKKVAAVPKVPKTKESVKLRGAKGAFEYIRKHNDTSGKKGTILEALKSMPFRQTQLFGKTQIQRISSGVYVSV